MEIRQAVVAELEQIIDIEQICFPPLEAAKEDDIRKRFEVFQECFVVAVEGNQVLGFINGCMTDKPELPDELYHGAALQKPEGVYQTVFGLDVLPEYQRKGIATKLMNAFTELARKRRKKVMVLTCKDHLIPFYESCDEIQ